MPFSEPTPFLVDVTLDDIKNSSSSLLNLQGNVFVNSLATALKRMAAAGQLPGQLPTDYTTCSVVYAETNIYYSNNIPVSACDVFICTALYSADNNTTLKIAAENVAGIKPTSAYTATLTKF
jgi:hypothetical protein